MWRLSSSDLSRCQAILASIELGVLIMAYVDDLLLLDKNLRPIEQVENSLAS